MHTGAVNKQLVIIVTWSVGSSWQNDNKVHSGSLSFES